ncbi:lignostilbene dioxygenase [Rhizodiscina lignyota]|uniref:Lignostilbene dioxygenase n=1 Tax=Rhizodiscina lignyota TaxID=1504668 RepID=A0A9P4IAU2_9PEZI|nr:lignostilbene dioxygenase [Rhizodiscina lignyota]
MDFVTKPLTGTEELGSKWSNTIDLSGKNPPVRLEGEIGDVIVRGTIPSQIEGTFYRVAQDPFTPPHNKQSPIDGHGVVTAFRIKDGRVDFKIKYVETERYLVERRARRSLFGLFKNPWSDHPCVRGVVDSTAQTNIIHWNKRLLVLRESANCYSMDPDTLETLEYDPYGDQVDSKAFTAHPKIDPFTNELVTFGYEAKGPGSDDVVAYSIDRDGKVHNEIWVKSPHVTFIHDMALSENFITLLLWPFEASVDRMKAGGHHFTYNYDLPSTFIVIPRRPNQPPAGWKPGEYRVYNYNKNCMHSHTASGWEENGKIYVETTRAHDNIFPFFPAEDGRRPKKEAVVDLVRYEIDPSAPTGSEIAEPKVLVDIPNEFPRIDERFMSKKYEIIFMNVFHPGHSDNNKNIYTSLNAVAMINTRTGERKLYWPGENCYCQEPVFVPRHDDAPEGDGWIMFMVERRDVNTSHVVFIDTQDFSRPVAVADLPLRLRPQIHGNWVDAKELNDKSLVREPTNIKLSGKGWDMAKNSQNGTNGNINWQ